MINIDKPICNFAIQTTGMDPHKDRIIEIKVVRMESLKEVKHYHQLINPGIRIPEFSSSLHQITNEMVSNKPRFEDIAEELFEFMKDTYWMGYNNEHLYNVFLAEHFIRCGINISSDDIHCIDIGNVYKKMNPRTLDSCYEQYTGEKMIMDNKPETVSDAVMEIFISMIRKHEDQIGESTADWEDFSSSKKRMVDFAGRFIRDHKGQIIINFGGKSGTVASEDPEYMRWIIKGKFPLDTKNWARRILKGDT